MAFQSGLNVLLDDVVRHDSFQSIAKSVSESVLRDLAMIATVGTVHETRNDDSFDSNARTRAVAQKRPGCCTAVAHDRSITKAAIMQSQAISGELLPCLFRNTHDTLVDISFVVDL